MFSSFKKNIEVYLCKIIINQFLLQLVSRILSLKLFLVLLLLFSIVYFNMSLPLQNSSNVFKKFRCLQLQGNVNFILCHKERDKSQSSSLSQIFKVLGSLRVVQNTYGTFSSKKKFFYYLFKSFSQLLTKSCLQRSNDLQKWHCGSSSFFSAIDR